MQRPKPDQPRGILQRGPAPEDIRYQRLMPMTALQPYIAHFWSVSWDFRDKKPLTAETLPHPAVQLIFERGRGQVVGVHTGKFKRRLQAKGRVFGIKFRPAAFRPCLPHALSRLTDKTLSLRTVFGKDSVPFTRAILDEPDTERCTELAEAFLQVRLPSLPTEIAELRDLVEWLATDPSVVRVAQVAARAGLDLRTLQRRFLAGVGVSPKWVIQRYRLHEAAEQLARPDAPDLASLAQQLGYFDQSHFVKDFKAVSGHPPGYYLAKALRTKA